MIVRIGRFPQGTVERVYADSLAADVTYDHVGSTLSGPPAATRVLGTGPAAFNEAVGRLRRWGAHRAIGARVFPADAPIEEGTTAVVVLSLGPAHVIAPTRIVAVVDEADAFGFAYGTLPGHPERGEESFVIRCGPDDVVRAGIAVDATGASPFTRAAQPLVKALQRIAILGYLRGLS